MAVPLNPGKKRAFGNDSWGFAPAIASLIAPKLTELNAIGGINLSCMLLRDQDGLTASTETVTLDSALCEIEEFEVQGATKYSMAELRIIHDPQAAALADGRKAWEALTDSAVGFLWRRQGRRATTDLTVGDRVDVVPIQLGVKVPIKTNNDASGIYAFQLGASVTASPAFGVITVT